MQKQNQMHMTLIWCHTPHAAAAAGILCHRQSRRTSYWLRSPSPRLRTLICNQAAVRNPGMPSDDPHLRNSCSYIVLRLIFRPRKDGRLSCRNRLTDSGQFTHELVNHRPCHTRSTH